MCVDRLPSFLVGLLDVNLLLVKPPSIVPFPRSSRLHGPAGILLDVQHWCHLPLENAAGVACSTATLWLKLQDWKTMLTCFHASSFGCFIFFEWSQGEWEVETCRIRLQRLRSSRVKHTSMWVSGRQQGISHHHQHQCLCLYIYVCVYYDKYIYIYRDNTI